MVTPKKQNENIQRACSSIIENYLPIFLPYDRLSKNSGVYKNFIANDNILKIRNRYGELEIRNRLLTQQHKDILEALLDNEKIYIKKDNSMFVTLSSRYSFLKKIGKNINNYQYLDTKLKELNDIEIWIKHKTKDGKTIESVFRIIDKMKIITSQEKGNTKEYKIKFTEEFTAFYLNNNLVDYRKHIHSISRLKTGFLKSIIRYMLIHHKHQININTFIDDFGFNNLFSKYELCKKKKEIKIYEKDLMSFGIEIIDSKVKKDFTMQIEQEDKNILVQKKNSNPTKQTSLFD